jgi:YaiO family outer membrane protein
MKKKYCILLLLCCFLGANAQNKEQDYYSLAKKTIQLDKNYLEASKLCKKGLEASPNDTDMQVLLGKCYLELKQYTQARYLLKSIIDKDHYNYDARYHLLNLEHQTKRYSSAICYANELLEMSPYSKELWVKKINIFNDMGNIVESQRAAKRLFQIFPEDATVSKLYQKLTFAQSKKAKKEGNTALESVLNNDLIKRESADKNIFLAVIDSEIAQANYDVALGYAEKALLKFKNNIELSFKKIKILELQNKYDQAITFAIALKKTNASAAVNKKLTDLMQESAAYYEKRDPYIMHKKLYELNKNKESLNYVLQTALSKGFYVDANYFLDQALKSNPNSKEYLYKQFELYTATQKTAEKRNVLQKMAQLFSTDTTITSLNNAENYVIAKEYLLQKEYEKALPLLKNLIKYDNYYTIANEQLASLYSENNQPQEAIMVLDDLLNKNPTDENYLLKKSLLLSKNDNPELGLKIAKQLKNSPKNNQAYLDQLQDYLKKTIEDENYDQSITTISELIDLDPKNETTYNQAIKVYTTKDNYGSAIAITKKAINAVKNTKEFKLKLADLYRASKDFDAAAKILSELVVAYPYNASIRKSLLEVLTSQANQQIALSKNDDALQTIDQMLLISPKDSLAFQKKISLYLANKKPEEALQIVHIALKNYPENPRFLLHKGMAFEMQKKYDSAYVFQSKYKPDLHEKEAFTDRMYALKSKTFKNNMALNYTKTATDSLSYDRSFVNLEYTRFGLKNNFSTRLYYAARKDGMGYQEEVQWIRKINPKYYAQATLTIGQKLFSKYSGNLSVFKNFGADYEAELGGGFYKLQTNNNLYQANFGISKTWDDYRLSLRNRTLIAKNKVYSNVVCNARAYLNPKKEQLSVVLSYGNSPVDQEIDDPNDSAINFVSTMAGIGYKKYFFYKTAIEFNGSWFSYNTKPTNFTNQYNFSVTLTTLF